MGMCNSNPGARILAVSPKGLSKNSELGVSGAPL